MRTTGILIGLDFVVVSGLAFLAWSWLREGEGRPARVSMALAGAVSLLLLGSSLLSPTVQILVVGSIGVAAGGSIVLFLLPFGQVQNSGATPRKRHDERDIMFARARLEPETPAYHEYYALRPENKASDDRTRSLPGLLSLDASQADFFIFGTTDASFGLTATLRDAVDGPVGTARRALEPDAMTRFIKALAGLYGAHSVGIAELQPYHVYSHIGRGSGEYGAPIDLPHRFAIAFTVEMNRALVGTAPSAPTVLESARQYVEAAKIGIQLGNLIRAFGFAARAHIDGNYRVIAPLVARDAGLGGIGRMGLLMTPSLGPRVRIGVVTTDLPLIPDQRDDEKAMLDFCRICTKCADNCPVRAIPTGDRVETEGVLRWRINPDKCYRYWCVVGTDCGRCMGVCPFSYPDNLPHNVVRWGVRRSGAARRVAFWMDRVFYGSHPPQKLPPSWLAQIGDDGGAGRADDGNLR